ncbi:hypothetical protein BX616_005425 [Lobosporangium transversale]|nr:hypothetical protein BX616_005425 [Lobosporangium transversale]
MGRNVPVTSVLPIMAYDTNATAWTDIIRPTIDEETSFVTNITRAAIIIGTIIFGMILLFIAGSTQYLRKWNQRNYVKVAENYELDDQQVRTGQNLPSILKKKYISQDGGDHNAKYSKGHGKDRDQGKRRKSQAQVIFEDEEGEYNDDDGYTGDEGDDSFSDDSSGGQKVQKVSLLSRPQANLTSRVPKRVRIAEHVDQSDDIEDEHSEEVENEEGQVIVQMPSDMPVE